MDKYDVEKLKAVTLYILKKCGATDYIHLFKILYFAEREHYADYGKRITKDTFIAMEHGPVPSFLYNALKLVTRQEQASADSPLWMIANAVTPGSAELYYFFVAAEERYIDFIKIDTETGQIRYITDCHSVERTSSGFTVTKARCINEETATCSADMEYAYTDYYYDEEGNCLGHREEYR